MSDTLLGIVVPGLVFGFSFLVTWLLYRHFAHQVGGEDSEPHSDDPAAGRRRE